MGNIIIIAILLIILTFAIRSTLKHFKGEGGCCGGGGDAGPKRKKLAGKPIVTKYVMIEGMHCENCKNSVEKQLNAIEGAAAKVSLKKKQAVVMLEKEVDDNSLKAAVEQAGFTVLSIQ